MKNNCYNFYIDDQTIAFFDTICWSIQKYSKYNLIQSIDLINKFHDQYPRLWEDFWYEHEGASQLMLGIFYEELGRGKYRDLNFSKFRQQFSPIHIDLIFSPTQRYFKIMADFSSYPVQEDISLRIDFIEKILEV